MRSEEPRQLIADSWDSLGTASWGGNDLEGRETTSRPEKRALGQGNDVGQAHGRLAGTTGGTVMVRIRRSFREAEARWEERDGVIGIKLFWWCTVTYGTWDA